MKIIRHKVGVSRRKHMWNTMSPFSASLWSAFGIVIVSFVVQAEELGVVSRMNGNATEASEARPVAYECLTPNNIPGRCVHYAQCPELASLRPIIRLRPHLCFNYRASGQPTVVCCSNPQGVPNRISEPKSAELTEDSEDDPNMKYLPTNCGRQSNAKFRGRIVGGRNAQVGEFPWMARLKYKNGDQDGLYCGGVLIGDRYVLTAAHCIMVNENKFPYSVLVGEHDSTTDRDCGMNSETKERVCSPPPQEHEVLYMTPHGGYQESDRRHYNDIALLTLKTPVQFNDFVQPICLPLEQKAQRDFSGSRLWVAGWGTTETGEASEIKKKVQVPIGDQEECAAMYRGALNPISISADKQICAGGEGGKDSCDGDSGGPLMNFRGTSQGDTWYVQGIVSFGPTACGRRGIPAVYTKVTYYLSWILSKLSIGR